VNVKNKHHLPVVQHLLFIPRDLSFCLSVFAFNGEDQPIYHQYSQTITTNGRACCKDSIKIDAIGLKVLPIKHS